MFDIVIRQITQESIPEDIRNKINGMWKSLISFFSMSSYVIAIIYPGMIRYDSNIIS